MPGSKAVSIVLATCNGARFLEPLLESLAMQRQLPFEVVVSDDHSDDDSVVLVRRFARSAPFPVHVHCNDRRLGYANNFLHAAERVKGDLVAFCDQDDIWRVDKLERVTSAFEAGVMLVAHYADVVAIDGTPLGRTFPRSGGEGRFDSSTLQVDHFPGFALTARRDLLKRADWTARPAAFDARHDQLGHDMWLWLLAGSFGEVVILAENLVAYRQHANVFGAPDVGALERARRVLISGRGTYADQARKWTSLGEYAATLGGPGSQMRAQIIMRRAEYARQRAELYNARNPLEGLRLFRVMLRQGVYRYAASEGMTRERAYLKDALIALGGPPLRVLERFGQQ
jgi:glycosyltransferase involved in cell wall biosynthesis